jgi:2-polyprenyl-3-methyl-5-hydroxy-6-metoxy-1,4-benzoquinol methylase
MSSTEKIRRRFDARAASYDNPVTAFIGERELRAIRKLVPPDSEVLDYGCGTGRTTLDLLRRGCTVTAYDISVGMLAQAETKSAELGFKAEFTADASRLDDRTWPVITCIGVLDYYRDPVPLLKILRAYLHPTGLMVATIPNALSPLAWMYVAGSRFTVPSMARTPAFVKQAAAEAGLQVVAMSFAFPAIAPLGHTLVVGLGLKMRQAI